MKKYEASVLLTVPEVAKLKDVTPAAVYLAVKEGRLPSRRELRKIGVERRDAEQWTPISYGGRPGAKGRRKVGVPMSDESKRKLSESQRKRWRQRKLDNAGEVPIGPGKPSEI